MNLTLPSYDGIEVDMLSLGDADCILVTRWYPSVIPGLPTVAVRVLIDGGNNGDAPAVKQFLLNRGVTYLDHIVCTHPHDDHAGGLLGVVADRRFTFGQFWMHLPWNHVNAQELFNTLSRVKGQRVGKILAESISTQIDLTRALELRGKAPSEPFAGVEIGFLTVLGPSQPFYRTLVGEFTDLEKITEFENQITAHQRQLLLENIYEECHLDVADATALGSEPTEPENDSSVVLGTKYKGDVLLFTGDAGVPALVNVANAWDGLRSCKWMQIPHHGSRRNISEELIEFFSPEAAFVSADGNAKHPRRRVVNAFKRQGATVFSTHYPDPAPLWYRLGRVPLRLDYGPAKPLYS